MKKIKPAYVYLISIFTVIVVACIYIFSGSAYTTTRNTSENSKLDGMIWDMPPDTMSEQWRIDNVQGLINSLGQPVVFFDKEIRGLNSQDGSEKWSYKTNSRICDAVDSANTIVALMDKGQGCNSIVQLEAATGKLLHTAEYANDHTESKLIAQSNFIAVVTKNNMRLLRNSDLVETTFFGDKTDPLYKEENKYKDCTISDVTMSTDNVAIAAMCYNTAMNKMEENYNIKIMEAEPKDSNQPVEILNVDSGSKDPVTLPIITKAMIEFIIQGDAPSGYIWEVTKGKEMVDSFTVNYGEYGFPYKDFGGIGYLWRVGNTLNLRYGSEDLVNPYTINGAIGNPMQASDYVIVPMRDKIVAWNPRIGIHKETSIPGFIGREFAFSGGTIMSLYEGTVVAYR